MTPTRRHLCTSLALALLSPTSFAASERPALTGALRIPPGYANVAREFGIPGAFLYGVALQESAMLVGRAGQRRSLPWPWTLNVAGTPARFASRAAAEHGLRRALGAGIDSVDVGPMQVNWRYHKHRLVSVERALEPYSNLRVGAALLAEHFADCQSWPEAIGRYHSPANKARAGSYSNAVFERLRKLGHA